MEFVSPEGLRQDGRRAQELRQLKCEIGVFERADGSATFEMGNTKVLAVVHGPKPGRSTSSSPQGTVWCEVAIASFCSGERRRRGRRDRMVQDISNGVQNTLEQALLLRMFPRSDVEVHLQVLQADGGEKAACINAAMLAIADAGVPIKDLVAACNVGYLESTVLLDLNVMEVGAQGPQTTVAAYPNLDKIATVDSVGASMTLETFEEVCNLAQEGCKAVAQFMRSCLLSHTALQATCQGIKMQ